MYKTKVKRKFAGGNATGQNYLDEIIELNHLHWNNMVYSETIQHIEVSKGKVKSLKSKGRFKYTELQKGESGDKKQERGK